MDAIHLLERYRDKFCVYNDDVQGTAGITLTGMINAAKLKGKKLKEEKKEKAKAKAKPRGTA